MKRRIIALMSVALVFPVLAVEPLDIAGADASHRLSLMAGQTFSRVFFVQSVDGQGAASVTVRVNPFAGGGVLIPVHATWVVDSQEIDAIRGQKIPGLGQLALKLSATLPKAGKYSTSIDLLYGGSRHGFQLDLERPEGPLLSLRDKEVGGEIGRLQLNTVWRGLWAAGSRWHPGEALRQRRRACLLAWTGCGTVGYTPDAFSPFLKKLVDDRGAAGVVGTEVPVWEELASEMAEVFFKAFLAGVPAGAALLLARRQLLSKNNPLGLVYTLYAPAALRLKFT